MDEGHRARKTVQKTEQKRASIFLKIIQCHAVHGKPIGMDSEKRITMAIENSNNPISKNLA